MANQTIIALDLSSSTVTSVTLSDYYAPKADPVLTGTVNIGGATSVSLPTNTTIGNVSSTELGYLDGVTSNIQSQLSTISLSGSVSGNVILPTYVANSAGAIVFEGSTADNNQLFLIPTDPAADVYLTLPAITDTVVTKTTTDTFTNKTFDTSATGNVFRVNGNGITAVTGTGSTAVLSASPTLTGTATVADLTINGNLTVNGTTTTINSTTLTVDDKLIELGDVASPTNTTANGGGLLLKAGAGVDKTILWDSTNANWTSSENWNIASGKTLKINNVTLLDTNAPKSMATLMGYTSTATSGTTYVLTNTSSYYQVFTGSTAQTITLPVTSTLITGWTFHIVNNNSAGNLTINSSGGNLVLTVVPGTTAMVTCIGTTLTTAADWEAGLTDFSTSTGSGSVVLNTSPSFSTAIDFSTSTFAIGASSTAGVTHNYSTNATASGSTKAINFGTGGLSGSTTTINIGSSASTTTVTLNASTLTGNTTPMAIFNTSQTTVNAFGAATTLNFGATTGTTTIANATVTLSNATALNINGASPSIVTSSTATASIFNTNALTGQLFGAATAITIGANTGTTTINNSIVAKGLIATGAVAPTIASATTIAPTTPIVFISGTTPIATITAPSPISTTGGQVVLIPTGAFTTTTAGNIAIASTAVVSRTLTMTYDATTTKWYPSY